MHVGRTPEGAFALPIDSLVQHAVCFGATGSGKTGMCVVVLEEVASAGVPCIVIDPKGDLANLALRFADPTASDLEPWVDPGLARREGTDTIGLAGQVVARMRDGWASDGVSPERRRAWADRVAVSVWTPGSRVAPVDVLGSLLGAGAPDDADDAASAASGLLLLLGHTGDPVSDPVHVVLTHLLLTLRRVGAADLGALITGFVDPPFDKVGVFPVETFLPRDRRMALAIRMNAVLAAPGFEVWSAGAPLDVAALLEPSGPRAPMHVFSLAHLGEAERQWFVASLLSRVLAWSRGLAGTSALRALVYLDEAFGYAPPHPAEPPSKKPLMTLMKQARSVGVGVMLATQNPVDLDYKLTANAATWLVGQLRTDQDRDRVLDGLSGVGGARSELAVALAGLPKRSFLVRAGGASTASVVRSRFAMSLLRGPMTEAELGRLPRVAPSAPPPLGAPPSAPSGPPPGFTPHPPVAPRGYAFAFLRPEVAMSRRVREALALSPGGALGQTLWLPSIYLRLRLRFDEGKDFLDERDDHRILFPLDADPPPRLGDPEFRPSDLASSPLPGFYAPLPRHLDEARELDRLQRVVSDEVQRGETTRMFTHKELKLSSRAGETLEAFTARVRAAVEDRIDAEARAIKARVEKDVERLETKRTRLERDLPSLKTQAGATLTTEVVSAGEMVFGLFFGRKRSLTTAVVRRKATQAAQDRVSKVEDEITALNREIYDLEAKIEDELVIVRAKHERLLDVVEEKAVGLERDDVRIDELTIVWVPLHRDF